MSLFYKETNAESTLKLYNKGIVYKAEVIRPDDNNIVDFHRGERFLYGRVRSDSTPVVLKEQQMLKSIPSAPPDGAVRAVHFVTDVFQEMTLQFAKCVSLNKIVPDDPFLSTLKAYRAYVSPHDLYADYKKVIFNEVAIFFHNENVRVHNFDDFAQWFRRFSQRLLGDLRFTFPGFMKSKECPILSSGLAIEIAENQDAANDTLKVENFTQSKNWDFFVNTCDTYGFMIDYNVPWRIVADIDSEIMRQIARRYGYVNPYDLLGRAYRAAGPSYLIEGLRKDMYTLYNQVRTPYWTERETDRVGCTAQKAHSSDEYSFAEFEGAYGFYYFLDLYLFLRIMEERPELADKDRQMLITDVKSAVKSNNTTSAPLALFERIINKEFDKVGSFSYIKEATKIQKDISFQKGERDARRMKIDDDFSSY